MKKIMFAATAALVFCACSQESNISASASFEGESNVSATDLSDIAPFFVFGENGEKYDMDVTTGELSPIATARQSLVVDSKADFYALADKASEKLKSDESAAANMKRPADYICNEVKLALSEEYKSITTKDGEVLLDDKSLMESCYPLNNSKSLAKTYTKVNYEPTVIITGSGYRVYGLSDLEITEGDSRYDVNPFKASNSVVIFKQLGTSSLLKNMYIPSKADKIQFKSVCAYKCLNKSPYSCSDYKLYTITQKSVAAAGQECPNTKLGTYNIPNVSSAKVLYCTQDGCEPKYRNSKTGEFLDTYQYSAYKDVYQFGVAAVAAVEIGENTYNIVTSNNLSQGQATYLLRSK